MSFFRFPGHAGGWAVVAATAAVLLAGPMADAYLAPATAAMVIYPGHPRTIHIPTIHIGPINPGSSPPPKSSPPPSHGPRPPIVTIGHPKPILPVYPYPNGTTVHDHRNGHDCSYTVGDYRSWYKYWYCEHETHPFGTQVRDHRYHRDCSYAAGDYQSWIEYEYCERRPVHPPRPPWES